jgi:hypothetical protein
MERADGTPCSMVYRLETAQSRTTLLVQLPDVVLFVVCVAVAETSDE